MKTILLTSSALGLVLLANTKMAQAAVPVPTGLTLDASPGGPIEVTVNKITNSTPAVKEYRLYRFRNGGEWVDTVAQPTSSSATTVKLRDYLYRPDVEEVYEVRAVGTDGSEGKFTSYVRGTAVRALAPRSMKLHVLFARMKGVTAPSNTTTTAATLVKGLKNFIAEASQNRTTLSSDTNTSWIELPKTPAEYCKTLYVLKNDPNIDAYKKAGKTVVIVEPNSDEPAGWGTSCSGEYADLRTLLKNGSPSYDLTTLPSNERLAVFFAGRMLTDDGGSLIIHSAKPKDMGSSIALAHEFGHSLGLPEGSGIYCPSASKSAYPFSASLTNPGQYGCRLERYGDESTVMGAWSMNHYTNFWKWSIGWLSDNEVAAYAYTPGQLAYVSLCSISTSPVCRRLVTVGLKDGSTYQLEYRNPASASYDAAAEGVHIHLRPSANPYGFYSKASTYMAKGDNSLRSVIHVGETFEDPYYGVKFTYRSASTSNKVIVSLQQ